MPASASSYRLSRRGTALCLSAVASLFAAASAKGAAVPVDISGFTVSAISFNTTSEKTIGGGYSFYDSSYTFTSSSGSTAATTAGGYITTGTYTDSNGNEFDIVPGNNAGVAQKDALYLGNSASGTVSLVTPEALSSIIVLDSTAGSGTISYTLNFADGSIATGTFTAYDWYSGNSHGVFTVGRTNGSTWSNGGFAMFEDSIPITDTSALDSVSFTTPSTGSDAIFAISGTPVPEPASLAGLALAGGGLMLRRRRR